MQIKQLNITPTRVKLTISTDSDELAKLKNHVLEHFQTKTKVAGFRPGKAPLNMVEKHIDSATFQSEFLDEAVNTFYRRAVQKEDLKVFGSPAISISKFVPFTDLEFDAEVDVLGKVKLPDYKKIKKVLPKVEVTAKDVSGVIDSLAERSSAKKEVTRAIKKGDEAVIDFEGVDTKKKAIKGADGQDYPLNIGSGSFIPGFEENLIGLKAGEEKTFELTFPKDYGVKSLADSKVAFTVKVKKVNETAKPKIDDEFAASVGPFKTLSELKADIKKQLALEKTDQAERQLENDLVMEIAKGTELELPKTLIDEQIDRLKAEIRQNIAYRGQTWQEMLEAESLSEEDFIKTKLHPEAEHRVKIGLLLAEISVAEKIDVSKEELDSRIEQLKSQYASDAATQAELLKPEARQDIASRLLTEKTIKKLVEYASK